MRILRSTFISLAAAVFLVACASGKPPANATLIDVMTLFVEAVQGDRYAQAMKFLTLSERARFDAAGGAQSPYVQRQLKALRLSTLASRPTVKQDTHGLLEGIYDQLPELPYTSEPPPTSESPADTAKAATVPSSSAPDSSSTSGTSQPDLP